VDVRGLMSLCLFVRLSVHTYVWNSKLPPDVSCEISYLGLGHKFLDIF
jgi:hypothetical protein